MLPCMLMKLRLGCIGTVLLTVLFLVVFWRPIAERMTDWTFEQTTEHVTAALPEAERGEAAELCERLFTNVRERGIPERHRERFTEFRKAAFGMLQNNEVTEEEARDFVERVRDILDEMYPEE